MTVPVWVSIFVFLLAILLIERLQVVLIPPPFPTWEPPANASAIYEAQRKVQRRSSAALTSHKSLILEARTPSDAGQTIHLCLTEFYRRCWDFHTDFPFEGSPNEAHFPQLPLIKDEPPRNWCSLHAYIDPHFTITSSSVVQEAAVSDPHPTMSSAPTTEEAVDLGVNIQCHSAMIDFVLSSTRYIGSRFGDFKVPLFPSHVSDPSELAIWRADGASFALYTAYTGLPINKLHPLFFLTLLPPSGSNPLRYLGEITGPILQSLDPALCDAIRAWFYLEPTDPIGNTLGDPVPRALTAVNLGLQVSMIHCPTLRYSDDSQVNHIGLSHRRTAREHVTQTQDLLSQLVVGSADFWQTEAFTQMHLGFHQVFYNQAPELTIGQVCLI